MCPTGFLGHMDIKPFGSNKKKLVQSGKLPKRRKRCDSEEITHLFLKNNLKMMTVIVNSEILRKKMERWYGYHAEIGKYTYCMKNTPQNGDA